MKRDKDDDVYEEKSLDDLEQDDEIAPEEEGFMQGYDADEEKTFVKKKPKIVKKKKLK